ncbi:DNA polymerase Y family protein [Sphingobium sp. H39-3-25]|uniref:Y-family DNA polymerase n=1 Tax=Sphingobium arseniciresistens TaxID=3030834 RepID=UPI0023B9F107|nr:DNA polymerase Y family protein [Sphingobium arseniciresistens]
MRRVVSLYLPYWSTDRISRKRGVSPSEANAGLSGQPLVTAIETHGRKLIASVDALARGLGIVAGMSLTKARTMVADLDVVDADEAADGEGLERLALWAGQRYAPFVAVDRSDGVWLDISGCSDLFGGEEALVKDLFRRVNGSGLTAQIAVADTAGCAHAVARHVPAGRPVIIPPGDQKKAVGLLPLAALRIPAKVASDLHRMGFTRIEQLIAEPRGPIARRYGHELYRRLDQALGHAPEAMTPIFPQALPQARRALLEPIGTADAIARVIGDLTDDICMQLTRDGTGARRLDLYCERVDGQYQSVRIGMASPTRNARHLTKLLIPRIERIDPGLGIETMILIAPIVEQLSSAQADLAGDERRGPDLAALIDALANRFGRDRLYGTTPRSSAMPERTIARTTALREGADRRWNAALPRPGRMIEPPEPIQVIAMMPDHPPAQFVWRGKRRKVIQADGPERLQGEWWRAKGQEADIPYLVRDYFQVEVEGGGRYWLFRLGDGQWSPTGPMAWFIHGAFA